MKKYEEGIKLIEERCGNKDNVIALATIDIRDNKIVPIVRDVDAYYEDCTFYIVTNRKSNKMQQILKNNEVAFCVNFEWFSGSGIGENLGWVLEPKNASLREKLRTIFEKWYDEANNENDENCCILAIHLTTGTISKDHGQVEYKIDFVNKSVM